ETDSRYIHSIQDYRKGDECQNQTTKDTKTYRKGRLRKKMGTMVFSGALGGHMRCYGFSRPCSIHYQGSANFIPRHVPAVTTFSRSGSGWRARLVLRSMIRRYLSRWSFI